jgi:hypothetical protein
MNRLTVFCTAIAIAAGLSACAPKEQKPEPPNTAFTTSNTSVDRNPSPRSADERPVEKPKRNPDPVVDVKPSVEPKPVSDAPIPPPPAPTNQPEYGRKIEGKAGYVRSPYTGDVIDVRGLPPGTEAQDPYTGRTFLVP